MVPIEKNHKLALATDEFFSDPSRYRRVIGCLIYLMITRPELCYSVHVLSQFMQAPPQSHWEAAMRVVQFLKGTPGKGLLFRTNTDLQLVGFSDFDEAACPLTRCSLTGYGMTLGEASVSWKTIKLSRSSAEAEYRALDDTVSEIKWLRELLAFFNLPQDRSIPLYCDNQAALHIAANSVFHKRTKHIENDCHFTRDAIKDGLISTAHIRTSEQPADAFTKALGKDQLLHLLGKLGICDLHAPP